MATLKQRMHKKNSSGTYDTVHLETSSSLVLRPSGRTVEQDLADYLPKTQASDTPPSTLKPSLVVGNTKTWVSIGETMQEIASKEDLSAMGGAKLVSTSSIGDLDGAVCKVDTVAGSMIKHDDYTVLEPSSTNRNDYVEWALEQNSIKTISLNNIDFDFIVLRPDPLSATYSVHCQYVFNSNSNNSLVTKFLQNRINPTFNTTSGNNDIVIYNGTSVYRKILLQTMSQSTNYVCAISPCSFSLSVDSSTSTLNVKSLYNRKYYYDRDSESVADQQYYVASEVLRSNYTTVIGPCLGFYTILYYKYQ